MPTWNAEHPLRSWLRKAPVPVRVLVETDVGDKKTIELGAGKSRWKNLEETILGVRAVRVEALDDKGSVIRARDVELDDEDDPQATARDAHKEIERFQSRERREMGSLLDAYGRQLNSAFDRGAAAANTGQQNLVNLVTILTEHLGAAITNLHNVSVNMANMLQEASDKGDGTGDGMMKGLLGMVAAKAAASAVAPAEAPPNGKKR